MYRAEGDLSRDPIWEEGAFSPIEETKLSPAASFLSFGVGIFEGLKAQRARDGRILLFRIGENAARFRRSAERLLMAPFPADRFVTAVSELVRRNERWVPPFGRGSFYVRPTEHAVGQHLGLEPSIRFMVSMFGSPVGAYFAKTPTAGTNGVRLRVLEQGRVAYGGTGAAKAAGNYAGGIYVAAQWKKQGFDDVLYLDAREARVLTETSGSNVFVKLKSGALVTPPLDDQILPGVTRDSVIRVARELLGVPVEERPVPIEEAVENGEEIFCTGTAWTVTSVREIVWRDRAYAFPKNDLCRTLLDRVRGIQTGEHENPFGWTTAV